MAPNDHRRGESGSGVQFLGGREDLIHVALDFHLPPLLAQYACLVDQEGLRSTPKYSLPNIFLGLMTSNSLHKVSSWSETRIERKGVLGLEVLLGLESIPGCAQNLSLIHI